MFTRLMVFAALLSLLPACGEDPDEAVHVDLADAQALSDAQVLDVASDAQLPDAQLPDAQLPDAQLPDAQLPDAETHEPEAVSFEAEVLPIFQAHCVQCHASGSNFDLTAPAAFSSIFERAPTVCFNEAANQPSDRAVIKPGAPEESSLWIKIMGERSPFFLECGREMPLGRPSLSDQDLETIRLWILQGAHQN